MTVAETKQNLRRQIAERLNRMTPPERAAASGQACLRLESQDVWKRAQSVLFYAPLPNEVDVWRLACDSVAAGKIVALPRFHSAANRYVAARIRDFQGDIRHGRFGIREPGELCEVLELNRLDLVLVPGVAFDARGRRLGRGRGFYDQLLASVRGVTCGVAFDEQIVAAIPVEPHDIHLNCILTPTRWIEP